MPAPYLIEQKDPRIAEVELATVEFAWTRPDSLIIDQPDWHQVSTPSSKDPYLNGVYFCSVEGAAGLSRIRKTIEEFKRAQTNFRWIVGPSTRPQDLESILTGEGMKLTHECLGMV